MSCFAPHARPDRAIRTQTFAHNVVEIVNNCCLPRTWQILPLRRSIVFDTKRSIPRLVTFSTGPTYIRQPDASLASSVVVRSPGLGEVRGCFKQKRDLQRRSPNYGLAYYVVGSTKYSELWTGRKSLHLTSVTKVPGHWRRPLSGHLP